jgi:hypothetical protein
MEVTGTVSTSCMEKKVIKRFVQCHVFARSRPDRRPCDKYPAKNSYFPPVYVKMFHSKKNLVAALIHIQYTYTQSDMCVSLYSSQYRDVGLGQQ